MRETGFSTETVGWAENVYADRTFCVPSETRTLQKIQATFRLLLDVDLALALTVPAASFGEGDSLPLGLSISIFVSGSQTRFFFLFHPKERMESV